MQEQPRKQFYLFRVIASLLLIVVAVLIFFHRQWIIDQITVWRYTPTQEVARLAQVATFTDSARFYFYASQPSVEDREAFNKACTQRGEQTVVLGCYAARRIYVFDVTDERLKGIKEVTAAHEMLHAAYDRLSQVEKDRVDGLIEKQYASLTDERIRNIVAVYDKTEPGQRLNELHSIFGTEVANLNAELEAYYKQYFSSRSAVVSLAQQYEGVFTQIKSRQTTILAELEQDSKTISARITAYNSSIAALNTAITGFNTKARSGGFGSQAAFDKERGDLLAQQAALNAERESINGSIAQYNQKREELETLNGQAESLNNSINSLEPVPSL